MHAFRRREKVASAAYQQKILLIIRLGQSLKTTSNKTLVSVTF